MWLNGGGNDHPELKTFSDVGNPAGNECFSSTIIKAAAAFDKLHQTLCSHR